MKKLIRRILGEYSLLRLKETRRQLLPTKTHKAEIRREQEQREKMKQFYSSFVAKGDLCFDVGANVGNRITPLLQLGARVVAIEPQDHCYQFLKYKFGNQIDIIKKGLGESEAVKDLYMSNASTLSSFSTDWIAAVQSKRFKEYEWNRVVKVPMTTLDVLIEQYGVPAFIKIDVEGYELNVLSGLTKAIPMVSFEYTVPEQVDKLIACIRKIEENGTRIECNFSIGESMALALEQWLSADEMQRFVVTQAFLDTEFGDVYVRSL